MEVLGMGEANNGETHMISAAAFVDGGIQDACDDSCSICLEGFCDSDPSTVTSCKHEFHLQCILEWCQRSSNCPMCWQNISLKDPASQELLEAVERERNVRFKPSRNATIFHHPTLGDFEMQHLPGNDAEFEDQIFQHLAAAAAMGRTHRIARREGSRSRSAAHNRPQFVVFSPNPNGSSTGASGVETRPNAGTGDNPSAPPISVNNEGTQHMPSSIQSNTISASSSESLTLPITDRGSSDDNRNYVNQSSPHQDGAGPSGFHSFSDNWRSRFSSMSMKYKESISKSTKELKEKLFSRSSSMANIGSGVRREVNAGIATVSRMMERLETRDNNGAHQGLSPGSIVNSSAAERSNNNRDSPDDIRH